MKFGIYAVLLMRGIGVRLPECLVNIKRLEVACGSPAVVFAHILKAI